MKYVKPEVTRMGTAIAAIQSVETKEQPPFSDAPQVGINSQNPPAYEADE